jgi:hypothetical protein
MERKMKINRSLFPGLLLLVMLGGAALRADGFIVIPSPPGPGSASPFPLEVVRNDVSVEIN